MKRRTDTDHHRGDPQPGRSHRPASLDERLLEQPRRTAGIDLHRQPVRLGERDTDGHMVGYIDEHHIAWESLAERTIAEHGNRLFKALTFPYGDLERDRLLEEALADLPDGLIVDVARLAGELLAIRDLARRLDP
jgi:hypothetical protein